MYEVVKRTNVSLWFAVSLWDSDEPVVQCGECLVVLSVKGSGDEDDAPKKSLPAKRVAPASLPAKKPAIDEREIDRELAAMKKRLGK